MANQLSKFGMLEFQSFKGLSKENHLGAMYSLAPQKATEKMVQLLANYRGKTLEDYLKQFPIKYFDDDNDYFWQVIGSSRRNIELVEARHDDGSVVDGSEFAGVAGAPFYLVFAEDWFGKGEIIVGEKNELYQIRVLAEPRAEGSNWVYKCEAMGGLLTGVPASEVAAGKRFSFEFAPVESSRSKGVGAVRYTTPTAMRNEWTTIRLKERVPGNMLNRKLAVPITMKDANNNNVESTMWMHYVEMKVEETFSEYKCNAIMYGKSNRNSNGEYLNYGDSGEVIKTGDGIRSQMEVANVQYYNDFDIKLLEDALLELSASKLDLYNKDERTFVFKTGERGLVKFNKAVKDMVSGWYPTGMLTSSVNNPGVISKSGSKIHDNALSAGFQFTEYKAPNNITIRVESDPLYDDLVRNKIMHPEGGPAMSYRFDILYIGTMDQPNIQIAKIKNQDEMRSYRWGIRNPFTGAMGNPYMSFEEDEAEFHRFTQLGVFILDPTRTMSIIPSILG